MTSGINRRGFLQAAAAGAASLALGLWKLRPGDASGQTASRAASIPEYTSWADVYRAKWTWDRVGRSTHFVNCWPQAHCTWNVYMKDGIVWREEQAGDYPLLLSGGHTRWSIHASWRDDALMLQQQRGEPVVYMALPDAEARGIRDGEIVRVWNDLGEFQVMAKLSPAIRPGMLVIYHAWENYQFRNGVGYQSLIPSPLNPVELSGGQYHLRPMSACLQPSHTDRDTRVEVTKRRQDRSWWSPTASAEKLE